MVGAIDLFFTFFSLTDLSNAKKFLINYIFILTKYIMCFNKETSLTVYFIGTVCYLYLFYRGFNKNSSSDKTAAILLLFITQMQLIEYFLWKNQKCDSTNKFISILIPILLYCQPVFHYLSNVYYYGNTMSDDFKKFNLGILVFFTFILFLTVKKMINWKNINDVCSLKNNIDCRLNWSFFTLVSKNTEYLILFIFFAICYFYFFKIPYKFGMKHLISKYFMTFMAIAAIIYTLYVGKFNGAGIVGSIYCLLCAFWGIFVIFKI